MRAKMSTGSTGIGSDEQAATELVWLLTNTEWDQENGMVYLFELGHTERAALAEGIAQFIAKHTQG